MPQKRSQPVSAPAPKGSGKHSKTSKAKGNVASSADANPASNSPPTPALTPSSSTTPPSSIAPLSLARSSKKLTKAVRQGHHHGNGGHGGHSAGGGKGTMKTRRTVGDGPEAELSGEEEEEDGASVVGEDVLVGDVGGENAPKSEVSMCALLDGAKVRPEPHNISRGYELLTSPASRLVIPFDSIPSITPKKPFATRTGSVFGGAGYGVGSTPSSPGFSDDVEWEWEDLCFEMDGVDLTAGATAVKGRKDAYAEVVKRAVV